MNKILDTTILEFDMENRRYKELKIDDPIDDKNESKVYWVHCNLSRQDDFKKLIEKLKLDEEIINLCYENDPTPTVIDRDESLTIQFPALLSTELNAQHELEFSNVIIHLTSRFCFSASYKEIPALIEFIKACQKALRYARTTCFIIFLILDNVVNDYARILYSLEVMTEQLDLDLDAENKDLYNQVMQIKRQTIKIKRYIIAIREIILRISGRKISVISEQCRLSLSQLASHTHIVINEVDSIRDVLKGLLDQIDNALMQRMNESMKVLTAFAAIFLPLTLITGIYGMNFHWMPELEWEYGYFAAIGLIFICGLAMYLFFKRKKWF